MLDLKTILADPGAAEAAIRRRHPDLTLRPILDLAERRRALSARFNEARAEQNRRSAEFGKRARDLAPDEREALRAELKVFSDEVKALEEAVQLAEADLDREVLLVPNLPDPRIPDGRSAEDNAVRKTWGEPRTFDFDPLEHDVLGERLGILDMAAAARVSGARFVLYRGLGARLERALAGFMLDLHVERHGYEEVFPPFLVLRDAMVGTGQLPKFEEEAFRTAPDDLFLIPTAEVPVTNMHRGEVLDAEALPRRYVAWTACFRREAGSYGRDTKGLTRLHQFQKVELVHLVRPEESDAAHESLTRDAEAVLEALGLPYRRVELCAGDLGFGARRCYDLEVWLPGQKVWREISSCSNFGDFQARRADLRYRPAPGEKPRFVHTLNGSGLAIGRTLMAILESYQERDGQVSVPEAIRPYMKVDRIG